MALLWLTLLNVSFPSSGQALSSARKQAGSMLISAVAGKTHGDEHGALGQIRTPAGL
jgi:hypothetical protein